jgi:zinc D-Ala-D-Ala carboxypeptidase
MTVTRLSDHFTLQEATVSQEAARRGIDNTPSDRMLIELMETAQFMERVRTALGNRPIVVTSWYRCDALEAAIVGLAPGVKSQGHHPLGAAVDFICPGYGTPLDIAHRLAGLVSVLSIGQLIYEFGRWVHISRLGVRNPEVNRVLTINAKGVKSGVLG